MAVDATRLLNMNSETGFNGGGTVIEWEDIIGPIIYHVVYPKSRRMLHFVFVDWNDCRDTGPRLKYFLVQIFPIYENQKKHFYHRKLGHSRFLFNCTVVRVGVGIGVGVHRHRRRTNRERATCRVPALDGWAAAAAAHFTLYHPLSLPHADPPRAPT